MKTHVFSLLPWVLIGVGQVIAQNVVPNPEFNGSAGQNLPIGGGIVNAPSGVPDNWRAFAVGATSAIDLEIVPLAADELFAGSPATNAILLRLNGAGADQGFDSDNGRFPVLPQLDYHAEFYVKSANADASGQLFNFGFPLFNKDGTYLGMEPGGSGGNTAAAEWTLFTGPVFKPADPVAQGHISWRCIDDGGENAILIALPSVTFEGEQLLPTGLTCAYVPKKVDLAWQNHAKYDTLKVLRDGTEIATLAVDATSYTDAAPPDAVHTYQVLAVFGPESGGASCNVAVFSPPDAGTKVSVDLNDIDVEDGLQNTLRDGATDGENTFSLCGPDVDLREGRSNWGGEDPTPDSADSLFYFTVTQDGMKAQTTFRLEVTLYDDPVLAGASLYLQWTNKDSTGPGDIPNTFFPVAAPPLRTLGGTGAWIVVSWDIENAGFRGFQQGVADFRVGLTGGGRVCLDRADLVYFPQPSGLACKRVDAGVQLTWQNNAAYAGIKVLRNGAEIATLAGDASSYTDASPVEGPNEYQVTVTLNGATSGPGCSITVFTVPPGTRVSVDLGDQDVEDGLANNVRGDPSDGENAFVLCGPESDLREARSNLAGDDPTPDAPDGLFYFSVTEPKMKSQPSFRLEVTIHDDPTRAGAGLFLQYTNADSTGPGDIPNTFFPLAAPPVNTLAGSGEWVVLAWDITNAGFRDFQQGAADFRLGVTDGGRVCIDKVELVFGEAPPKDPLFHRGDADNNGQMQLTDAVRILNVLFLGTGQIPCADAADADDNGQIQLTDAVRILNVLFLGTGVIPEPAPPPAACGVDPTDDALNNKDCAYTQCGG